jgi:hypothetical protein
LRGGLHPLVANGLASSSPRATAYFSAIPKGGVRRGRSAVHPQRQRAQRDPGDIRVREIRDQQAVPLEQVEHLGPLRPRCLLASAVVVRIPVLNVQPDSASRTRSASAAGTGASTRAAVTGPSASAIDRRLPEAWSSSHFASENARTTSIHLRGAGGGSAARWARRARASCTGSPVSRSNASPSSPR